MKKFSSCSTSNEISWHRKFDIFIDKYFNSIGSERGRIRSALMKTVPVMFAFSTIGSEYAELNFQVDCSIAGNGNRFLYNAFTNEIIPTDSGIEFIQSTNGLDVTGELNGAVKGKCFYHINEQYFVSDAYPVEVTGSIEDITTDWSPTFHTH